MHLNNKIVPSLALLIIISGALLLRLYNIENKSIWYDETISISHAEKSFEFYLTSFRVSYKPVYFFLLNLWIEIFGENTFFLRFFSVIWGVSSIWVLYRLSRLWISKEAALISAFLLSISVFHIFHCQQIRQFSLVTLLSTSSFYFFSKYLIKGRGNDLLLLLLFNILLIHVYPTGFFPVFIEFLLAIMYMRAKDLKRWGLTQIILVAFLVRLFLVADKHQMVEMVWWVNKPDFLVLWETLNTFVWGGPRYGLDDFTVPMPSPLLMLVLVSIYVSLIICGFWAMVTNRMIFILIFMWLLMPAILLYVFSVFGSVSLFSIKHLIISLPAFFIVVAYGLSRLGSKLRVFILFFITLLNCLPLFVMYHNQFASDWDNSTKFLKNNIAAGDVVIVSSLSEVVTFMYYFDKKRRTLEDIDIYGRISRENYGNNVFTAGYNNLIIGVKQTGFGDNTITSRSDFDAKMNTYADINKRHIWTILSRWADYGVRGHMFSFLEKSWREKGCFYFRGIEVCHFEPK